MIEPSPKHRLRSHVRREQARYAHAEGSAGKWELTQSRRVARARLYSAGYLVARWLSPKGHRWHVAEVVDRVTAEPRGFRSVRFAFGHEPIISVTPGSLVLRLRHQYRKAVEMLRREGIK